MSLQEAAGYDTSSIVSTWEEIGYSQEEQEEQQAHLNETIIKAIQSYQESLEGQRDSMKSQIQEIYESFSKLLHAFGKPESELQKILSKLSDEMKLKEKLELINTKFSEFKDANQHIIDKFENLHSQCSQLLDRLEVKEEDRGEFATLNNDDYTNEKMERYEDKLKRLKSEIENREKVMKNFFKESTTISNKLEIEMPQSLVDLYNSQKITLEALKEAEDYQKELIQKKEVREEELSKKLVVLQKLWNILDVKKQERQKFINSFKTIGDSVVKAYDDEADKLRERREEKLPEIVENQKRQIKELEATLHLTPDQIEEIPIEGKNLNDVYDLLDQRYDDLYKEYTEVKTIVESINQREELIKESEELAENARKLEEKLKKKKSHQQPPDQKQAAKDEQAKRRINSLLPRVEKKLYISLIEYQTLKNCNFLWDGEEYIQKLEGIKISPAEIQKAKNAGKKKGSSRRTSHFPEASSKPLTVETGKKRVSRRSLENKPCIGNQHE